MRLLGPISNWKLTPEVILTTASDPLENPTLDHWLSG